MTPASSTERNAAPTGTVASVPGAGRAAAGPAPSAAAAFGWALRCVLLPLALAVGLLAATSLLPVALLPTIGLGLLCAALAVAIGTVFHGRARAGHARDGDPLLASQRLQAMLGGSFLAKLLVLALGFGGLVLADVKFPALVAFALAFAGAALLLQLVTVLRLTRMPAGRPRATNC